MFSGFRIMDIVVIQWARDVQRIILRKIDEFSPYFTPVQFRVLRRQNFFYAIR
jgi:hypothetical protein